MKRRSLRAAAAALLAATMLLCLAGCAQEDPQPSAPTATVTEVTPPQQTPAQPAQPAQPAAPAQPEPQPAADNATHVSSTEELLDAIASGVEIVIEPGYYNMSELIDDLRAQAIYDKWGDEHPYVSLDAVYDGSEVVISNADGLTIRGGGDSAAETELVIDARYGTVLTFDSCTGVTLANLTMGHTDGGDCSGNVLKFRNCADFTLSGMDLYGCGVYGVEAGYCDGSFAITDSTLRDCDSGPFAIYGCTGNMTFTDCILTGSNWGGSFDGSRWLKLRFSHCVFGEQESNVWAFSDDAVVDDDCLLSEPTEYPDYSYMEWMEAPSYGNLDGHELDRHYLSDSVWHGLKEDGYPTLYLHADGTAELTNWNGSDDTLHFNWTMGDGTFGRLEGDDGEGMFGLLRDADADTDWLNIEIGDKTLWMY
ncbi:MAG: right-handed parallel beta-helix repeat-containing protein [Ruminococcaceae bacterium]|nr:right-handed parallel beta-helix repeat-containing protein [Oscillospiraceae bacterium]